MTGSGSGGEKMDEKKRRRMESNRESARRSRQRKQQHLDDLVKQVGILKGENEELEKKIGDFATGFATVEVQNRILRSEQKKLADRLESLQSVIDITKVVGGSNGENELVYEMNGSDDPMMKPWQLPFSSFPIIASSALATSFNFNV